MKAFTSNSKVNTQKNSLSKRLKERWKNPDFREKMQEIAKSNWKKGLTTVSFMGRKHTKETKKKMKKKRMEYFERIDKDKYRKYHIGKKQSKICKKKHSILSKKMWSDKEWAIEMRRKLSEANKRPDVRKKISKALKGKPKSKEHIEKVREAIKKKWQNPEYKAKMIKANNTKKMKRIRSKNSSGKNNAIYGKRKDLAPNWKGGISNEPYPFEFNKELKEKIKKRDDYTCQLCRSKKYLHIHHIDYNKQNCVEYNLVTLCRKCNGKVNFNRESWTKKFKQLIFDKYNY